MKNRIRKRMRLTAVWLLVGILCGLYILPASAAGYPMTYRVYYVNEAGKTVAPMASGSYEEGGAGVSVRSPEVEGYVLKDPNDAVVSSDRMEKTFPPSHYVRNGTATYTVVYTNAARVTVRYLYANGSEVAASRTVTGRIGESYQVTSPTVSDYTPDRTVCSGIYSVADKTETVIYYPTVFRITYHPNGGIGAPASEGKYRKDVNYLSSTVPTRSGYRFLGWSRSATATSASWSAGARYDGKTDVTLYAVWRAVTYTVRFDPNGGIGAPSARTKKHGIALTLPDTVPTRSGYVFLEWNTTAAGNGISYAPGGMLYRNADTVLYAIWQPIAQTWTVTYHANGGSGAPSAQTKTENAPLSLSDGIPTRTGYRFLGWATAADADRVAYLPGAVYSGNAALVLYAVWEPEHYRITYHPNGGADAPDAQEKLHDTILTLRQEIPTRNNYRFLGWSTVQDATVPEFLPGDRYTEEGDRTLYAVWEFINYDFSVSDLSVSSDTVYQYDTVTVRCILDNWDPKNGYSHILVEILLDGVFLWQTEVEFAAYGVQFVTFTLRVGALVDTHTLTARVNWEKHWDEVRSGNNETSITLTVRQVVSVYSNAVTPNAGYLAGCEVVTAFLAHNDTATPLMPEDGVSFLFEVYCLDDAGREVLLERQTWERVVVPANGKNLVWFRWTVPADAVGSLLWCRGTANPEGLGNETDRTDNSAFFTVTPKALSVSDLPDARYEKQSPESYDPYAARPESTPGRAVWNQWCWENGELVLKTYGVRVGGVDPSLTADPACPSAKVENDMLYMKSGYGILLSWSPTVVGDERYEMPDAGSYTQAQNAYVRFPETGYSAVYGCYQTLEYSGGAYRFPSHPNAVSGARLRYVPIYIIDGTYLLSVSATQIWTPAGMLTATRNATTVVIDGTVFDDWYLG